MHAGLQCLRTSSPARWTWLSWRTARRPWSAWPRGCQLPVSLSPPSSFPGGVPGVRLHAPCISSPSFPVDISWYKGNEQLVTTPGRILSRDGKRLEIPRAHLSDAGSYRCVASNAAGDTELGYSLRVTGESVGYRGRTEAVRGQGAPPGPSHACMGAHPCEMGLAETPSSAPFAITPHPSLVMSPKVMALQTGIWSKFWCLPP